MKPPDPDKARPSQEARGNQQGTTDLRVVDQIGGVNIPQYKVHPLASIFPLMDPDSTEFIALVDEIRDSGLIEPIVLDGDVLVDGRNRLAACTIANVAPKFVQFAEIEHGGASVTDWIWIKNFSRRHLNEDQKIAAFTKYQEYLCEEAAAERKAQSKFKKGECPNPTGRAGKQVDPKSGPPDKRDIKAKHSNSSAGQLAAKAGTTRYKAEQMLKVAKAEKAGSIPSGTVDKIVGGQLAIAEAAKQIFHASEPMRLVDEEEVAKAVAEAERDSAKLWALKGDWRRAGKRDRVEFLKWLANQGIEFPKGHQ